MSFKVIHSRPLINSNPPCTKLDGQELYNRGYKPHEGKPMHPCPFQEEIKENGEDFCTCCDACRHECAMDI